jgi:hypothetical protein
MRLQFCVWSDTLWASAHSNLDPVVNRDNQLMGPGFNTQVVLVGRLLARAQVFSVEPDFVSVRHRSSDKVTRLAAQVAG